MLLAFLLCHDGIALWSTEAAFDQFLAGGWGGNLESVERGYSRGREWCGSRLL